MASLLDSLVRSCAQKLQDVIMEEAILVLGVKEELRELQRRMYQIQCFLNDVEQKRTEESSVNNWLRNLKDAMHNADDIVDLARFEGSKLLAQSPLLPSSSSRNLTGCTGLSIFSCLPTIRRRHEIAIRIRDFNAELDKILKLGKTLFKIRTPPAQVPSVKQKKTCQLVEPNLVGKEILQASTRLVELLLAHKEKKPYKIGILGTGGIGKTTLAQKIYNGHKVKETFSKRAWVCVSQTYSEDEILKEILNGFEVHQEQGETFGKLISKLAKAVEGTCFMIVLDDVWHHDVWTNLLRTPLNAAASGVIIVTSRHDTVPQVIGVDYVHGVKLMSKDLAWELLWKSMNINEEKEVQHLKDIGMEIVSKCGHLPLAIKVTASVLATKDRTERHWRKVINKSAWFMDKLPDNLRGALFLSYDELSRQLKQCFLYCVLFPEDYKMFRDDLIRCWVAEGFVEEQDGQLLEETAEEYYDELIHRNLLQPTCRCFDHHLVRMHTLLRQLAQHLSGDEIFCGDTKSLETKSLSKIQRVTIFTEKDYLVIPDVGKERTMRTRTLTISHAKLPRVEDTIFKRFPHIRVLDLTGSKLQCIPSCIGDLIHLRLVDLDQTDISCLPESIGCLQNLQILNLQRCGALHSLPLAITKLRNLRRLGLNGTPINEVPKGIGKLKFLNDLEAFPIGRGSETANVQDGWILEELGPLSQLRQLHMIKLEGAAPPCSSRDSLLTDKKHLKFLELCCSEPTNEAYTVEDVSNIGKIFEELTPPRNLEELVILGFFGWRYPTWLDTTHLCSLKLLKLEACRFCEQLPPLGQLPNLACLQIAGATTVTKIGPEFLGFGVLGNLGSTEDVVAFPKLEYLTIRCLPNWDEWSFFSEEEEENVAAAAVVARPRKQRLLPCLNVLILEHCPKLRGLPRQLGREAVSLTDLIIREAKSTKMVEDLPFLSDCLSIEGCEALERVSNIPQVRELHLHGCPNFKCVEDVSNLQGLCVDESIKEIPSVLGLLEKGWCGDELDVHVVRNLEKRGMLLLLHEHMLN